MFYFINIVVLLALYSSLVPNPVSCISDYYQSDALDADDANLRRRTDTVLKVALYNEANFHGEVWPAFAHAFIQKGHMVDIYAMDQSSRMVDMVTSWIPRNKVMPPHSFQDRLCHHDVIVFITMQRKGNNNNITAMQTNSKRYNADQLLDIIQEKCPSDYFEKIKVFGVVHDPLEYDKIVVSNTKVRNYITLSAHVTNVLEARLAALETEFKSKIPRNLHVYTLPPIFPIDQEILNKRYSAAFFAPANRLTHRGIVVQGIVSPKRRDYTALVEEALRDPLSQPKRFNLTIVGSNAKKASEIMKMQHPQFDSIVNLQQLKYYADYYGMLMQQMAIYPAFAQDGKTLSIKASSTVPCSLICNTPLIASKALLHSYSYLDEDAVWLETRKSAPFEVLVAVGTEQLEAKLAAMERNRRKIYEGNSRVVDDMLTSAVMSFEPRKR